MRTFSYSLVLSLLTFSSASYGNNAQATAAYQNQMAAYNLMTAKELGKSGSKSSKMLMMMQMMQANANMAAAQQNQKNGDKQEKKDKEETKKSEQIAKLEIPEFKAPVAPAEEKGPDLSDLTYKPSKEPLPLPPIPSVDPNAAAQILAGLKPIPKDPTPSPTLPPVAQAPVDPGPSKIGKPISLPEILPVAEQAGKVGFDNTLNSGIAGRSIASQPATASATTSSSGEEIASMKPLRRGKTDDEVEFGGGGDGGGEGKSESGGYGSMLADLFGFKLPGGDDIPGDIEVPEKEEAAGGNIFEYASYRYRKLEIRGKAGRYNTAHLTQE